jgi:hypothetical protein
MTVCKVHDNANYLYTELENCKKNHFTFVELNVAEINTGYFTITVSETDKKEIQDSYLTLTYVVLKCNPNSKSY